MSLVLKALKREGIGAKLKQKQMEIPIMPIVISKSIIDVGIILIYQRC